MNNSEQSLSLFDPIIRQWFSEQVGTPTGIQSLAWPVIAERKHVLLTAPTGSGKTLTAFLWAVNQLLTGAWERGGMRVLYVSPLKALNNDIQKNLVKPLKELRACYNRAGKSFPEIRVLTRSGDTPQKERRQMCTHPPEILITTPESLNILLTSKNSRKMFAGLQSVILDEVHAVIAGKRGTHLITAVDRLVPLCGEFQRIALSATVNPLERVADFIGGFSLQDGGGVVKREVAVVRSNDSKGYRVTVAFPEHARDNTAEGSIWPALVDDLCKQVAGHTATLFFTNSRKIAEKVSRLINEHEDDMVSYAHHGSLSREIRLVVEQKMKGGELKAIVATSSLEMGIDIGELEHVILIQTPFAVSSAIQRVGRSGHRVGEVSKGTIYPTYGNDFVEAAVMARAIIDQDIEEVKPVEAPLDVLAQVLLSMVIVEEWDIDKLYLHITCSYPYRELSRKHFDLVIEMLAGRYSDTPIRELSARISIDKIDNTVRARDGAAYLLYMSGGTIPDRGMYDLRVRGSNARIGELDEEFVWERNIGDSFTLGTQVWKIHNITHNDVEVVPLRSTTGMFPFWKAEQRNRDFHYSQKILDFLAYANTHLHDESFTVYLQEHYCMDAGAAGKLAGYLKHQADLTGVRLPHRNHVVIEHFDDPMNRSDNKQVIIHTLWGGMVNHPFGFALAGAWEEKYGYKLEVMSDNNALILLLPHRFKESDIFDLVNADTLEKYLRKRLETTGYFGARFRENAGRALLLTRASFKRRLPLWLNRLRSKKLLEIVMGYHDFPVLLETWRTCLRDEFDLPVLKMLLDEIQRGEIRVSETVTRIASPFAGSLIWRQTNKYMYEDDTPTTGRTSDLSDSLIKEVASSRKLRPLIPQEIIDRLEGRLRRTIPGYAPEGGEELLDWVREHLVIPADEWEILLAIMTEEQGVKKDTLIHCINDKTVALTFPGGSIKCICAIENLPFVYRAVCNNTDPDSISICKELSITSLSPADGGLSPATVKNIKTVLFKRDAGVQGADNGTGPAGAREQELGYAELLRRWLMFYGPVPQQRISALFGIGSDLLQPVIDDLSESGAALYSRFREGADIPELCDSENLEILLRMVRRSRQPVVTARPVEDLAFFLASHSGIVDKGNDVKNLQDVLDMLFGYPAHINGWEEYIFPARLDPYYTTWLDSLLLTSGLAWAGTGIKKGFFMFNEDSELFGEPGALSESNDLLQLLQSQGTAFWHFHDITGMTGYSSAELSQKLWELVWEGHLTNDTFEVVRKGIANNFTAQPGADMGTGPGRRGYNRWKASRPMLGNWRLLEQSVKPGDLLEEAELMRDRVRQLLLRYGILFRELLERELPLLRWKSLFKTLRLMELSGEVLTGHFFEGIEGLQFISHEAFRELQVMDKGEHVYWINACDPVSLCGIGISSLKELLPRRIQSNWLVYDGSKPVMIISKNGAEIQVNCGPDDEKIPRYLQVFKDLLNRQFNPFKTIKVKTINGEPVAASQYKDAFKVFGFRDSWQTLELTRRY